jgi:AhpD family alkylhydroperoxidase
MQPRITQPAAAVPGAMQSAVALGAAAKKGIPASLAGLIHLRASQINGCAFCVEMHAEELKQSGASEQQLMTVAAWRDAPYFTDAERAVLALTEAATRIADRGDVADDVWAEAARRFNEAELASIVLNIAMINFWNLLNVTTRQPAGSYKSAA